MMRFLILIFLSLFLLTFNLIYGQDAGYARKVIDTLASPTMEGRGYADRGDHKAAEYIAGQFRNTGLEPLYAGYFQEYSFPMNTFPGKVEVVVNNKKLVPAREFLINASSPGIIGQFRVQSLAGKKIADPEKLKRFIRKNHHGKMVMIDKKGIEDKKVLFVLDSLKNTNLRNAAGLIFVEDKKLTWSVMAGASLKPFPVVEIKQECLPRNLRKVKIVIENEFVNNYRTQNVLGFVKGSVQPDTFLVFTAHYDHLGRMGNEVYFPGANDNASGTAMLLDLARHYSMPENKLYYSMAFFALSGEEAGILGSSYCAEHPPFPLNKIKFLVNLDMVGTGSGGVTMVNATVFRDAYNRMVKINADNEYIRTVKERGESCNSDHCPFYKKGVPAVFIYSMGDEFSEYHNPDDAAEKLPLSEYKDIFRLLSDFMDGFKPNDH
ncbi:MAG TPA: M28 family peptidase [Bacteroidales bacterium]|nr:M28 family peptidase [Bacteroidales bacterium]HPT03111.1 M28 family peptidase [Bacteroidales bacterium]